MVITTDVKQYEYSKQNIENLEISCKIIGDYSFYNSKLKKLLLNEGIEIIGERSFFNNILECVYLPDTIKRIGLFAFNQTNIIYKNHLIKGNIINQYDNFIEISQNVYNIIPNFDFNKTSPLIINKIYKNNDLLKAYYYNLKIFSNLIKSIKNNLKISYIDEYIIFKVCIILGFFTANMNNVFNFLCDFTLNHTIDNIFELVENIKDLHYYPNLSKMLMENIDNVAFQKIFVTYFNNYNKINKIINRNKSYLINKNLINKKYGREYQKITKKINVNDVLEVFANQVKINSKCLELKKILPILLAYINQEQLELIEEMLICSKNINDNDKYFMPLIGKGNNFIFKWLSGSDVNNFIAGYLCDSCARPYDEGEDIIKQSMINPLVKTMVMYEKNRMIAKTTCYYNLEAKALIFNTFSINKDFYKVSSTNKRFLLLSDIIRGIKKQIEEMNKKGYEINSIRVGTEYNLLLPEIEFFNFEEANNILDNYPFKSDNAREKQIILINEK